MNEAISSNSTVIDLSSCIFFFFFSRYEVNIPNAGLLNLESLNLSFTVITDGGLRRLSGLSSLKSLNLDARQITDAGLAALTSMIFGYSCCIFVSMITISY